MAWPTHLPLFISGIRCISGTCEYESCDGGFGDCDLNQANGCETHTSIDTNNCGSCGHTCPPNWLCIGGICDSGN